MGDVAGADEAEQTPQAPEQALAGPGQRTEQKVTGNEPATEQPPTAVQTAAGSEPIAAQTTEQAAKGSAAAAAQHTPNGPEPAAAEASEQAPPTPGFGERGRMRRRARFLRKARELAYRDLGGLVFDLHRFGQRNDPLVLAKLATLRQIDTEVRELEEVLRDRRSVTVLREVGIAACPRCAAIHGSDDRFCPGCGLTFDANADRPISTAPVTPPAQAPASASASPPTTQMPPTTAGPSIGLPLATPVSPAPTTDTPPSPQPANAPTSPKVERPNPPAPPKVEPTPPVKPTAVPVAVKPAAAPSSPERKQPDRASEDEPTQILRPPARDS